MMESPLENHALMKGPGLKASAKLPVIVALGLTAVGAAGLLRHYVYSLPTPPAPVTSAQAVATDAKVTALEGQIAQLKAAVAQHPTDIKQHWALADAYQKMGELALAADELNAIVRLEPGNTDARLAVATVDMAMKEFKPAEINCREVIKRHPRSSDAWRSLAATLYHEARYLEASEAARKAVALQPGDPNGRYILATSLLEYSLQFPDTTLHVKELMEAGGELKRLKKIWSKNGDIDYRLGRVCMGLHDGPGAIKYLVRAKSLEPDFLPTYSALGEAYLAEGDRPAAEKIIHEAQARKLGDAGLYDLYGRVIQTSTEPDAPQRMFDAFQKAVQMEPDNPQYHERFGVACLRLNKLDQAQSEFQQELQLDPEKPFPYQQLAAIYSRKGDTDKANLAAKLATGKVFNEQQLKEIVALSKTHPGDIPLHLVIGDRFRDLGKYGPARDEYLFVQRLDPGNKRAKDGLAAIVQIARKAVAQDAAAKTQPGPAVAVQPVAGAATIK